MKSINSPEIYSSDVKLTKEMLGYLKLSRQPDVVYRKTIKYRVEVESIKSVTLADILLPLTVPDIATRDQLLSVQVVGSDGTRTLELDAMNAVNFEKRNNFQRYGKMFVPEINVKTGQYESMITAIPNLATNVIVLAYNHTTNTSAIFFANMPTYINPRIILREVKSVFPSSSHDRISTRTVMNFKIHTKDNIVFRVVNGGGTTIFNVVNSGTKLEPRYTAELSGAALQSLFGKYKDKMNIASMIETNVGHYFDVLLKTNCSKFSHGLSQMKWISLK